MNAHGKDMPIAGYSDRLGRIATALEKVNKGIGRVVAWCSFGSVSICFSVVVLRYGFDIGIIWLQELYVWLNAFMFMVGAGPTFAQNEHVRVDVLYGRMTNRRRCYVNIVGTVFLLFPFLTLIGVYSWSFVSLSWQIGEDSGQIGGLPGLFVLKSSILAFVFLVGLHGVALIFRSLSYLSSAEDNEVNGQQDYLVDPNAPNVGGSV